MSEKLHIKVLEIPLWELFQVKEATGRSILSEVRAAGVKGLDEQMTAGLIWIVRKRTEPDLKFADVWENLNLGQLGDTVVIDLGGSPNPSKAAASTTRRRSRPSSGSTEPGHRGRSTT